MKNSKFWNIGLSLFLLMATIGGCSSDSSSSGSSTSSDTPGASSDSSTSTDATQQSASSASDTLDREDGVVIKLYGNASVRSSDGDRTVIDVKEGGGVLYFSYADGPKLPIDIVGESATISVLPSESPVSQEPSKASYATSIWQEPTFVNISAPANLIATGTGDAYGYVVYANSQLYHTPQVTVVTFSGVVNVVDELPLDTVDRIVSIAADLKNTRQAAKSGAQAADEVAPVASKALRSIGTCGEKKLGKFLIPIPCPK